MSELQSQVLRHLRKEYRKACRMNSTAMKLKLFTVAKQHGIERGLITQGE